MMTPTTCGVGPSLSRTQTLIATRSPLWRLEGATRQWSAIHQNTQPNRLNTGRLGGNTPRPTGRLGRRPGQHFPGSDRGKPHLRSLYSLSKFQAHTVEGRGASQGGRQKIPTNTQPKHQILAPDFTESRLLPKTDDTDFKNMQPRGFEATTIGPTEDC